MSLYRDKYNHVRIVSGITAYIDKLAENEDELGRGFGTAERRKRRKTDTGTVAF